MFMHDAHKGLLCLQVLLVVVSTLNWQLYARPTLEIIDYLLQDPFDGRYSALWLHLLPVRLQALHPRLSTIQPQHLDVQKTS